MFRFINIITFLLFIPGLPANDYPIIDPPAFSHPGGFYQQAFELELHTPYDGTYNYSVNREGYDTVSGEVVVTTDELEITVVLHQHEKLRPGYDEQKKGNPKGNGELAKISSADNIHKTFRTGTYVVNFYVDMTDSPIEEGDEVYISGTMADPSWPEPGTNPGMQMQPLNDDPMIYFISFNLDAGDYQYKYFLNPGWGDGEWSGSPNREITVNQNISFHDTWGIIDPDYPGDPDGPHGLSTITFIIQDQDGNSIEDAVVTFNGITYDAGMYIIENVIPAAVIRYTVDGSIPSANSPLYTAPISITDRAGDPNNISMIPTNNIGPGHVYNEHWQPPAGEVKKLNSIRAATFISPHTYSKTRTHSYLVDEAGHERYSMPLISINAHEGAFFDPDTGIYHHGNHQNYSQRGPEWERLVHLEFFESTGGLAFAQDMGARIHGGTSRNRPRKSLRMYAREDYGTTWVDYHLFPNKNIERYKRFLLRNSGNDWGDAIFRDAFMQSLIEDLQLDIQYSRPAIVFMNGEYWGIKNIRDRLDNRYIQTHYGLDDEMDYTILDRNGEFDRGNPAGRQHYLDMISFLQHQGVASTENYAEIKTRMDVNNFADYQIAQIYWGNTDWPGNNIQFWRFYTDTYLPDAPYGLDGLWRWQVFDVDFGFGLNFDYVTGVEEGPAHNTLAFALAPNGPSWPNPPWSTLIFRRLTENTDFRNHFINRFADLLNTNFRASHVVQKLEEYREMYLPEMPEHIHRWQMPHDMAYWDSEIDVMRNYALERPGYMRQFIAQQFNLTGTAKLTVQSANPSQGGIRVNTIDIHNESGPWTGTYFKGVPIEVAALPYPGYAFSFWEGDGIDDPTNPVLTLTMESDMTLVAHYQEALVHFWHFNNLPEGTITSVIADHSNSGSAKITYPGTGNGYMDRTDGTLLNAHQGVSAGYGLRVRNPSDTRQLLIEAPSVGYKDLTVSFAVHRTTNGAQQQSFHYSSDGGESWTQAGSSYAIHPEYKIISHDLRHIAELNDNPDLRFKILFEGQEAGAEDGNNRFDNIVIGGTSIELRIGKTNPPAGYKDDHYPGHYFTASGGTPPYTFSITSGSLPSGLELSESGLLSGAPTVSGSFAFIVNVSDQDGASDSHLFTLTIESMSLIHYWHFNNLPEGNLVTVEADHYLTYQRGSITYPGTGTGYMDRADGTLLNTKLNAEAGYALRVRNPSHTRELIFHTPSNGYEDLAFSFAVQRTNNGARQQELYFSANGGSSWTLVDQSYVVGLPFGIRSFDLSGYPEANNNPDLKIRILFKGSEAAGDSGNNRFDNVALQGRRFNLSNEGERESDILEQNFPNPFRHGTTIPFEVTSSGKISIDVYDIYGMHVENLLNGVLPPGKHEVFFDAGSYPAGMYIYTLRSGVSALSRRMIRVE